MTEKETIEAEVREQHNLMFYAASVRQFLADTAEWGGLSCAAFHTSDCLGGWKESNDNAHGGLDVAWAFARARGENAPTDSEIEGAWARLCAELAQTLAVAGISKCVRCLEIKETSFYGFNSGYDFIRATRICDDCRKAVAELRKESDDYAAEIENITFREAER